MIPKTRESDSIFLKQALVSSFSMSAPKMLSKAPIAEVWVGTSEPKSKAVSGITAPASFTILLLSASYLKNNKKNESDEGYYKEHTREIFIIVPAAARAVSPVNELCNV